MLIVGLGIPISLLGARKFLIFGSMKTILREKYHNACHYERIKIRHMALIDDKFYSTPTNMIVLVHQINKLIVKSVIF